MQRPAHASFASLWTLIPTGPWNVQKKYLANIQPSWPQIYQNWSWHTAHLQRTGQFLYIQVWRHSVIVVASTKYPAHKLQTTWGFRSQILITTYYSKIVPCVNLSLQQRRKIYVSVKSKLQHPPPGHTPGIWHLFLPGREGIWSPLIGGGEFDR